MEYIIYLTFMAAVIAVIFFAWYASKKKDAIEELKLEMVACRLDLAHAKNRYRALLVETSGDDKCESIW